MPRWLQAIRSRLSRGSALWALLCLLLAFGLLTTLIDLAALPHHQTIAANKSGHRVIIDPVSGLVAGTAGAHTETASFDVSEEPAAPELAPEPEAAKPAPLPASTIDGPRLRTTAIGHELPTLASTRDSLVLPPAPEITELGKEPLPKRGGKDATPAALYAKRFQRQEGIGYISVVFTDVGYNAATLSQILKLPADITVAFSPYALDPKPQIALMRTAGFETWGMLPAQSARYPLDDPGPIGVTLGLAADERSKRLKKILSTTLGAVGLILPPDEIISTTENFAGTLNELETRGLFLLVTHPRHSIGDISEKKKHKKMIRRADVILDATASRTHIQSQLAGLPELARTRNAVVVMVPARPHTVRLISEWLASKPLSEHVKLAPLSAIYGPATPPPLAMPVADKPGERKSAH